MEKVKNEVHDELVSIKKLLIVALVRSGLSQTEVATALGVNQTTVSRMFPEKTLSAIGKARGR